jgi:hypothetical protein
MRTRLYGHWPAELDWRLNWPRTAPFAMPPFARAIQTLEIVTETKFSGWGLDTFPHRSISSKKQV